MRTKSCLFMLSIGLAAALLVSVSTAGARQAVTREETALWELRHTRIIHQGDTVKVPADPETGFPGGVLTTNFTIEAKARAKSGSLVPDGVFQMTLSAFWPAADMPAQRAGAWYVEGTWRIVDQNAEKGTQKVRHNPFTVKGRVKAALPFNPALEEGKSMSMKASVPMSPAAGHWARSRQGVLTLNAGMEGEIQLPLTLWPKLD